MTLISLHCPTRSYSVPVCLGIDFIDQFLPVFNVDSSKIDMTFSRYLRLNDAQQSKIHRPTDRAIHGMEDFASQNQWVSKGDQEKLLWVRESSSTISPDRPSISPTYGKPATKKRLHTLDILAACLSLACFIFAVVAVGNETVSWHLGRNNYQLIISGFLLSIMNLCLGTVTPTLFLLIEARLGSSTLQNYDGIVRNQLMSSGLNPAWRLALGMMLVLPLGLSVAYKNFTGGESVMNVNVTDYIGNASYYGMFPAPGVQTLGLKTGISLFFNATLPFEVATSQQNGVEPSLPTAAQAYGYNVLLLNNESTAILDIQQPSYISNIQALLDHGESWIITSPVVATVATLNHTKLGEQRSTNKTDFVSFCEAAKASSGAYTHQSLMNLYSINLLDHASPGDQSLQYVGFTADTGIGALPSCSNFSHYAKPYTVNRQFCKGTWSITQSGFQLLDGSCNGTVLPPDKQMMITDNTLFMGIWYMPLLAELIGPFSTTRNQSQWLDPYFATSMAAMLWSKITALNGAANIGHGNSNSGFANRSYEDVGLIYPVHDTALYVRPTLRKSSLLYCVFAIQPLLTVGILGLIAAFHSTPVDKGFGLIAILSGIHRASLDILAGAALSGELKRGVKLVIDPVQDDGKGTIEYRVLLPSAPAVRKRRLASNVVYY